LASHRWVESRKQAKQLPPLVLSGGVAAVKSQKSPPAPALPASRLVNPSAPFAAVAAFARPTTTPPSAAGAGQAAATVTSTGAGAAASAQSASSLSATATATAATAALSVSLHLPPPLPMDDSRAQVAITVMPVTSATPHVSDLASRAHHPPHLRRDTSTLSSIGGTPLSAPARHTARTVATTNAAARSGGVGNDEEAPSGSLTPAISTVSLARVNSESELLAVPLSVRYVNTRQTFFPPERAAAAAAGTAAPSSASHKVASADKSAAAPASASDSAVASVSTGATGATGATVATGAANVSTLAQAVASASATASTTLNPSATAQPGSDPLHKATQARSDIAIGEAVAPSAPPSTSAGPVGASTAALPIAYPVRPLARQRSGLRMRRVPSNAGAGIMASSASSANLKAQTPAAGPAQPPAWKLEQDFASLLVRSVRLSPFNNIRPLGFAHSSTCCCVLFA
jgi:hypothetical protein